VDLRTIFISAVVLSSLGLAACGSGNGGGEGLDIVATTGITADLAERVAGPDAAVTQLIPDGSSPHDFQLSAEDRQELERADLIAASGAGLEATIPLDEVETPTWELAESAGALLPLEAGHEDESGKGGYDPHVWMDPTRVATALPSLAAELGGLDPQHRPAYRGRATLFARQLSGLDRRLRRTLAAIPAESRELVTSHDSLAYFADRYGFEVVATAFPVSGPEGEPSAGQLDDVSGAVEASGVAAVFAGEEDDPEVLRLIADDAGIEIVDDLLIESPGEDGTYESMLRHDAEQIARALGG
jgi:ABC-type Zn uptake system ZnuABC Zn-binding protein ZnuA